MLAYTHIWKGIAEEAIGRPTHTNLPAPAELDSSFNSTYHQQLKNLMTFFTISFSQKGMKYEFVREAMA